MDSCYELMIITGNILANSKYILHQRKILENGCQFLVSGRLPAQDLNHCLQAFAVLKDAVVYLPDFALKGPDHSPPVPDGKAYGYRYYGSKSPDYGNHKVLHGFKALIHIFPKFSKPLVCLLKTFVYLLKPLVYLLKAFVYLLKAFVYLIETFIKSDQQLPVLLGKGSISRLDGQRNQE